MIRNIHSLRQWGGFSGGPCFPASRWILACGYLAVGFVLTVVLFKDTIAPAVSLWRHNSVYNYCFLIIPITIGLAWSRRDRLRGMVPMPSPWGLGVIMAFGVLWCLAYVSGVAEAMQFAVVGLIQGLLLSLFGGAVYRRLWLPFSCLWLLVPSGQFLVPLLQTTTAVGAAALLPLAGVPVYRENLLIMAPHGSYMVAPGCSGLSFFLASLVVGAVFAELTYRRWPRKLGFTAALLAMSVAGNSLRVFLIIAVAEWAGNVGDIIEDHLLYGWGFFSLLLLGAMAVGHRYREESPPARPSFNPLANPLANPAASDVVLPPRFRGVAALALAAIALPSLTATAAWPEAVQGFPVTPALSCGSFVPSPRALDGSAAVAGQVDGQAAISCERGGRRVRIVLAVLNRPVRQGKLLGLERRLIDQENWSRLDVRQTTVMVEGQPVPVQAEGISHGDAHRLVWSLFWIDGAWRAAGLDAVWADLRADLAGLRRATLLQVSTDDISDEPSANVELHDFLSGLPLRRLVDGGLGSGKS